MSEVIADYSYSRNAAFCCSSDGDAQIRAASAFGVRVESARQLKRNTRGIPPGFSVSLIADRRRRKLIRQITRHG